MTKKTGPIYLDLDAVAADRNEIVLKLNGKEHTMKHATVRDFVENTKSINTIGAAGDLEAETASVIGIIKKGFPDISEEDLWDLGLDQLNAIMEFLRENNGENDVTEQAQAEAEAEGNATATA